MKWVLIIFISIFALILLISFMKLKIKVDILHNEENNHIKIKMMVLFGLISYTYNVPFIKVDEENPSLVVKSDTKVGSSDNQTTTSEQKTRITPQDVMEKIRQAKEFLEHVVNLRGIVKRFINHITIHKLEWNSSFGLGDAARTGMATGVLWSLKGSIVGILAHYMRLKSKPVLNITPHFLENVVRTKVICIFSFRIGHAILGGLRVVKYWKSAKGGKQHVRTSNSGLNDNSYGKFEAND